MQFLYENNSNSTGIYKITNLHSNRVYIGQAQSFKKRWMGHASSLRSKRHQNKFIQNDYNKCLLELGNDDFLQFTIIEVLPNSTKLDRKLREEYWISQYFDKQKLCYNFKETASSNERSCYSNTPEETSKKLSEAGKLFWNSDKGQQILQETSKRNWQKPDYRNRMLSVLNDRWNDPKFKKKMHEKFNSQDHLVKASAITIELWNNTEYREKQCKIRQEVHSKLFGKNVKVIGPDGNIYETKNIMKFCRENNICYRNFRKMLQGLRNHCHGWRKYIEVDNQ
jgi:group I intron endonuclease